MLVPLLFLLLQSPQSQPIEQRIATEPPSVVVGVLRILHVKTRQDAAHASSLYVHDNEQPFVIEVERTLAGPEISGMVSVAMQVDKANGANITWVGSYGLLDPEEWYLSRRLVAVLNEEYFWGGRCIDATGSKYCTKLSKVFLLK